jgi:peptidyl-tRNA hydrolase, PTH1 family
MKLVVGLGNVGAQYANTRHNVGFMVVDALATKQGVSFRSEPRFFADVCKITVNGHAVLLVKPTTYMNLSGKAVASLVQFYKLDLADCLIVVDDVAIPLGTLRVRAKGSSGGQNGLKSIAEHLGQKSEIARLRLGIGQRSSRWTDLC